MEVEDELVQEIPVYFSQDLSESLYLLQYPLRPSSHTSYEHDLGTFAD